MTTPDKAFTVDFVARTSKVTAAGTSTWWCTLVLNNSVLLKNATKVFRYPYELRDHTKLHTNLGKFFCKEEGCKDRSYSTKKALQQHKQLHDDKVYTCDVCSKTFATKGYLQQHFTIHDKNFVARCGEKCKNPTAQKIHQKDCKKCAAKQRKFRSA